MPERRVDRPMDAFDDRLAGLLTAYGDRAVTTYDAAGIAAVAFARRPLWRVAALSRDQRLRVVLAGVALVLLALAGALIVGSRHPSPIGDRFASPTVAVWSPDGSQLAFIVDVADGHGDAGTTSGADEPSEPLSLGRPSHPELFVVGGDGGAPRRLAVLGAPDQVPQVQWTPDGRSLLVAVDRAPRGNGRSAILQVGLDGTEPQTLVDAGSDSVRLVGPSAAGDKVAFVRSDGRASDLFAVDPGTRSIDQLASHVSWLGGTWSPDGRWILYDGDVPGSSPSTAATWVVSPDGRDRHRVGPCCSIGWSADGRVFYQAQDGTLRTAAVDGTDVREVPGVDASYGWIRSPDGSRYLATTPDGLEIVRPGEAPVSLTTPPGPWDRAPSWSPDGRWIAFYGAETAGKGEYVVPSGGGVPRLVAPDTAVLGDPWRPGTGPSELTLMRDRAIVTVEPDRGATRDLVGRATVAGDGAGPVADAGPDGRIVIGASGPEHDVYRVPVGRPFLTFENRSDIAWTILLDGFDVVGTGGQCLQASQRPTALAAWRGPVRTGTPVPASPADCVTVGPHSTVRVTPGMIPPSPAKVVAVPEGAGRSSGIPVLLDLAAGE